MGEPATFTFIDVGEVSQLDDYNDEFGVAILSWLINKLPAVLKDEIEDIHMKVFMMTGKFGGRYPAIALYSYTLKFYDARYRLIEETCTRLLKETLMIQFLEYLTEERKDWSAITAELLGR